MARDKTTPLHFDLPDNDSVDLITWEHVLHQLSENMKNTLIKMAQSNQHLDNIATKLESFIDNDNEEV